jgi:hypothetical protein
LELSFRYTNTLFITLDRLAAKLFVGYLPQLLHMIVARH